MKHRALTEDGDWTFGKGLSSLARGVDAVVLNVKTRLASWKGDCVFDLAEGVDYTNYLSRGTKVFLDSNIKRVILKSEGVLKITQYKSELQHDERHVTIRATIDTIYGRAEVVI